MISQNSKIIFQPVGIIHTPHLERKKTPIQSTYAEGIEGEVHLFPEYQDGLKDLECFSHIYLLFHFHQSQGYNLHVKPFLDDNVRGLFSTRSPRRPNSIGISIVRILSIHNSIMKILDVDMLDGTPLLDIKPYISRFDIKDHVKCGWQDNISEETARIRGRRDYGK